MVTEVAKKMIEFSDGNLHDINHFMKVYAYAKTIGSLERLPADTQEILEIAALVHDIACPLCREKYGNTNGKYQELEGPALAKELLEELSVPTPVIDRVTYLVGHHHTYTNVDGLDYQILLEADFLVNADESQLGTEAIKRMRDKVFQTASGIQLLDSMYLTH